MKYLWCMKRNPGGKIDRNQWIAVAICQKNNCDYLEFAEGDEKPICHHPTSLQYVDGFKGDWKKRREEEAEAEDAKEGEECS